MFKTTAFDLLLFEKKSNKIVTLFKGLDDALKGGIQMKLVTEFCGGPGTGKTQFCLQLCIVIQFPKEIGGCGAKAIYIDTNQDFNPNRLEEIAESIVGRFNLTTAKYTASLPTAQHNLNSKELLNNIQYIYCSCYIDLIAAVNSLRELVTKDQNIKLVIIDSFSFPLRNIEKLSIRTYFDYMLLTELQKIAHEFDLAVIITNELTTRLVDSENDKWSICPSLGEIHGHKINQRILLSKHKEEDCFMAILEKTIISPKIALPFKITKGGIRSVS